MADEKVDTATKNKLALIDVVREFAIKHLHQADHESYTYYAEIDRDYVAWNVSACQPLKFEEYTWWFPIAGTVPYKGFFDKEYAREEYEKLKEKGLDARLRPVPAYSTLGWFSDPIFSSFLKGSDSSLIELVIHEMSHATLYISSDTTFNESFASFVEQVGTEKYFQHKGQFDKLMKYRHSNEDYLKYISIMKLTAEKLEKLYSADLSDEKKKIEKKIIIDELKMKVLSGQVVFHNKGYQNIFKGELNNAHFQSILRYQSGSAMFQRIYDENGKDMKKFLEAMQKFKDYSNKERRKRLFETVKSG